MPVPGPTDDEWKKMTSEQKTAYKSFGFIVGGILLALLLIKILSGWLGWGGH